VRSSSLYAGTRSRLVEPPLGPRSGMCSLGRVGRSLPFSGSGAAGRPRCAIGRLVVSCRVITMCVRATLVVASRGCCVPPGRGRPQSALLGKRRSALLGGGAEGTLAAVMARRPARCCRCRRGTAYLFGGRSYFRVPKGPTPHGKHHVKHRFLHW
jgi:hypothetical protein